MSKLTALAVRNEKPTEKSHKLFDEGGLFLKVEPNGSKYWRFKFRFGGKEDQLAFGVYPEVSLAEARERRDSARLQLRNGQNPKEAIKARKQSADGKNSFAAIANEWFDLNKKRWADGSIKRARRMLDKDLFPWLGNKPIQDITAPMLLMVIKRIDERGARETANRVRSTVGAIFRFAIATGRANHDVAADLQGAIPAHVTVHLASITEPKAVGELLRAIEGYVGHFATNCALSLAPLVFTRPGELRQAEWSEINFEDRTWRIPAARMKARRAHIVPLSDQALAVFEELLPVTGNGKYVFPSVRTNSRPMSDNTVNAALRRMGYSKDQMTGHGFRHMASTLLHERGFSHQAIELQLAHADRDSVSASYNFAQYLDVRRPMMQQWADYLDLLKAQMS